MVEEKQTKLQEVNKISLTMLKAKARAYSNMSIRRPLTEKENKEYKETMEEMWRINNEPHK